MPWLLTGGAGYIGSHITLAFEEAGTDVVVLDDLSTGYRSYVPDHIPFVDGSVADAEVVAQALDEHEISGVVHLAGLKYAGVSVDEPLAFYRANVTGTQVLLEAVAERGIENFVFSGSSSWYGTPEASTVAEDAEPRPESPYGRSKVIGEWLVRDVAAVTPGLKHCSLRYFNVVGSGRPELADHSPHNLFPKVFRGLSRGEAPVVFGIDYDTPDGTCVRDYIHVVDLADAHVAVAKHLEAGNPAAPAYNVGRGEGSSVLEVMRTIRRITGHDVEPEMHPRRPGDPARIVGAVDRIAADLDWHSQYDLDDMVSSAWAAWQHQLEIYGGPPPDGARLAIGRPG
jgi:UDP-glucose 4-epimerase